MIRVGERSNSYDKNTNVTNDTIIGFFNLVLGFIDESTIITYLLILNEYFRLSIIGNN